MALAQHNVVIARPIDDVFDYLADGSHNSSWQPPVVQTTQVEGSLGVGTTFRQTLRHPLGFRVPADYRLTAYERPKRFALLVTSGGPIRPTETFEFAEQGPGRTRVLCTIEYRPEGLVRLARPLLALLHPIFSWEASWLDNARDILESSPDV
jgi:uncharacterized protein YndB with AHSA1/START domain